jgi:hypothetical protein
VCPITQAAHEPTPSDTSTPLDGHPHLDALRSSVERLRNLAAPMTEQQLPGRAYPTEWTVAQVLSHLGSGAVITQRRLEDVLTGRETPDDFAPSVWDTWNAKSALAQRDDALAADAELHARLQAVARQERNRFRFAMGRMSFGFDQFVGLRLNEHAFPTWDVEVVADPAATVDADRCKDAHRSQPTPVHAKHAHDGRLTRAAAAAAAADPARFGRLPRGRV